MAIVTNPPDVSTSWRIARVLVEATGFDPCVWALSDRVNIRPGQSIRALTAELAAAERPRRVRLEVLDF